jgi:hypothetical protein
MDSVEDTLHIFAPYSWSVYIAASFPSMFSTCVFGSVVAGAFQITFRAKMHVNDVFLFFKNYFWHQHIKTIQNIQIIFNFNKKQKFLKFLETQPQPRFQTYVWMPLDHDKLFIHPPCGSPYSWPVKQVMLVRVCVKHD